MLTLVILSVIGTACAQIPPPGVKRITGTQAESLPKFEPNFRHRAIGAFPECFDARTKWPKCKSIADLRNQGMCGTCWAVASSAVLSDRLCIESGGKNQTYISAEHIAGCTDLKRNGFENCQGGNDAANAYRQVATYGVVTGGHYDSKKGCMPYPLRPLPDSEAIDIVCRDQCTNAAFKGSFEQDKIYIDAFWTSYVGSNAAPEVIEKNVQQMKMDILANGPLTAAFQMFSDFDGWTPEQGAYRGPAADAVGPLGGHAVRIIGWCKDQNKVPYWLISNSWGAHKGDKGLYWIEMGKNVVGIEDMVSAPIIKQPNNCPKSICDAPFDQVIRLHPADPQSPVFVFQGNCTTEVTVSAGGKITPVGVPDSIAAVFIGGPNTGPITHWSEAANPAELWFANSNGKAGVCFDTPRKGRKGCRVGRFNQMDMNAGPVTVNAYRDKYIYYTDAARANKIYKFAGGSPQGVEQNIGDAISSKFKKVTSILDLDNTKMLVCGVGIKGLPACGTLTYDTWKLSGHNTLKKIVTKC